MTRKILDCCHEGLTIVIEYREGDAYPYRVFQKWYDSGWHRKQIGKGDKFVSCLLYITDLYTAITK